MKVLLTVDAEKQFKKLPMSERRKVEKKLKLLAKDPQAGKKLAGAVRRQPLAVGPGPTGIIYMITTTSQPEAVIVLAILHRQGAYR